MLVDPPLTVNAVAFVVFPILRLEFPVKVWFEIVVAPVN
jgi:hypothetical protein